MSDEATHDGATHSGGGQPDAQLPEITFAQVCDAVRAVKDPEIGLSIVELGLLYGHEYDPHTKRLTVRMTLTSQMCPAGPELVGGVKFMASRMENVDDVEVELVWNPPWDPKTHCSEDAKAILGIWE
jgi:metal-sulfur cluster biosynthetic enzyme